MLADQAFALPRPRGRHVLLVASFVVHALVIGWLAMPERAERVTELPEAGMTTLDFSPRIKQPCTLVWIERQSGCVITRKQICASSSTKLLRGDDFLRPEGWWRLVPP